MYPNFRLMDGLDVYIFARVSNCGLDFVHGPHQVAEKQMSVLALEDMNSFKASGESKSVNVILFSRVVRSKSSVDLWMDASSQGEKRMDCARRV